MSDSSMEVIVVDGLLVEESETFTLIELSRAGHADVRTLLAFIEEGVISVDSMATDVISTQSGEPERWRFSGSALGRVRRAMRLSHDLELNAAGVAMALDLLDEIASLRARLRRQGSKAR